MFWENFVLLCNKKGITPNGVCSELNLSNAAATKWKNGAMPRSTTLHKIAEYFDVSISDLTDPPIKKIAKSSGPILSSIPEDAPTEFTTMEIDRSEVEKRFALQNKKPADEGELVDNDKVAKVALFGGDTEVTDEMWSEVMNYAEYIKQKYGKS